MNRKILVIYLSKTGFTERYARWIGQALPCDLVPYQKRNCVCPEDYDLILFGSRLHAGSVTGIKWLQKRLPRLKEKNVAVFVTGANPPESPKLAEDLHRNFAGAEWEKVKRFYLHSGLCYEKMGPVDKLLMAGLRTMLKKDPAQAEALAAVSRSSDFSSMEQIGPLVSWCRSCL